MLSSCSLYYIRSLTTFGSSFVLALGARSTFLTNMFLQAEAATLIERLAVSCTHRELSGSISTNIYDTAWVSMVSKKVDGHRHWLFPESFQLVLDSQLPGGGWEQYASDPDGILNTMAALLAFIQHRKGSYYRGCCPLPRDIDSRIFRGISWLEDQLQRWNVAASDHVGFEILVPALLDLFRQEEIQFHFPGSDLLAAFESKKIGKFSAEILYGQQQTTLLHSLEAFAGKIDFDRASHHMVNGSHDGFTLVNCCLSNSRNFVG